MGASQVSVPQEDEMDDGKITVVMLRVKTAAGG
jgi:hypothetical protein